MDDFSYYGRLMHFSRDEIFLQMSLSDSYGVMSGVNGHVMKSKVHNHDICIFFLQFVMKDI